MSSPGPTSPSAPERPARRRFGLVLGAAPVVPERLVV